jgi:hypothetical protein
MGKVLTRYNRSLSFEQLMSGLIKHRVSRALKDILSRRQSTSPVFARQRKANVSIALLSNPTSRTWKAANQASQLRDLLQPLRLSLVKASFDELLRPPQASLLDPLMTALRANLKSVKRSALYRLQAASLQDVAADNAVLKFFMRQLISRVRCLNTHAVSKWRDVVAQQKAVTITLTLDKLIENKTQLAKQAFALWRKPTTISCRSPNFFESEKRAFARNLRDLLSPDLELEQTMTKKAGSAVPKVGAKLLRSILNARSNYS